MPAWMLAIPGRVWVWTVALGAAVAAGAWLLLTVRQGGRDAEKIAQAGRDMEAANARIEEDGAAARAADPAGELQRRWGR